MSVFIKRVKSYEADVLQSVLAEAASGLGFSVPSGARVLLKPNIVAGFSSDTGYVTHAKLTAAVVRWLQERGATRILVGEGPGVGLNEDTVFDRSGYRSLCDKLGVELLNLHATPRVERQWKYGTIELPRLALECDLYINIAKAKTHGYTKVTLGLKNQKGLLAPEDKKKFHHLGLHEPIAALAEVVRPHLTIVDGITGIEADGPLHGRRTNSNFLLCSTNVVDADASAARLMGFEPEEIPHIRLAAEMGLGSLNPQVLGDPVSLAQRNFLPANPEFGRKLNIYSWRNIYACSMCIDSFTAAVNLAVRRPRYWFSVVPRLVYWSLFGRLDIIQGKNAERPAAAENMVCLGVCTKEFAEREQCEFIPGCPPRPERVLKVLACKPLQPRRRR